MWLWLGAELRDPQLQFDVTTSVVPSVCSQVQGFQDSTNRLHMLVLLAGRHFNTLVAKGTPCNWVCFTWGPHPCSLGRTTARRPWRSWILGALGSGEDLNSLSCLSTLSARGCSRRGDLRELHSAMIWDSVSHCACVVVKEIDSAVALSKKLEASR